MRCGVEDSAQSQKLLELFFGFEREEVAEKCSLFVLAEQVGLSYHFARRNKLANLAKLRPKVVHEYPAERSSLFPGIAMDAVRPNGQVIL